MDCLPALWSSVILEINVVNLDYTMEVMLQLLYMFINIHFPFL